MLLRWLGGDFNVIVRDLSTFQNIESQKSPDWQFVCPSRPMTMTVPTVFAKDCGPNLVLSGSRIPYVNTYLPCNSSNRVFHPRDYETVQGTSDKDVYLVSSEHYHRRSRPNSIESERHSSAASQKSSAPFQLNQTTCLQALSKNRLNHQIVSSKCDDHIIAALNLDRFQSQTFDSSLNKYLSRNSSARLIPSPPSVQSGLKLVQNPSIIKSTTRDILHVRDDSAKTISDNASEIIIPEPSKVLGLDRSCSALHADIMEQQFSNFHENNKNAHHKRKKCSRGKRGGRTSHKHHRKKSSRRSQKAESPQRLGSNSSKPPLPPDTSDDIIQTICKSMTVFSNSLKMHERLHKVNKNGTSVLGLPPTQQNTLMNNPPQRLPTISLISSPKKCKPEKSSGSQSSDSELLSPRKSVAVSRGQEEIGKITKIYLSEKHSGTLTEMGLDLPCAPPSTPMPTLLQRYEYVPSMYDIRAQRAVRLRLEMMEKHEKRRIEKILEEKLRQEKLNMKEKDKQFRQRQRLQIYTLNKAMTEFENHNFQKFCQANGIDPDW